MYSQETAASRCNFQSNLNLLAFKRIETLIQVQIGYQLNSAQKTLLFKSLYEPNKTYEQIAEELQYSPSYVKRYIAPQLWQLLSTIFEGKVSKANCREQLEKILMRSASVPNLPESPQEAVPLNSGYYIERPTLEQMGCEAISQPTSLIQVKALKKMGKTSFIYRIIERGKQQNYYRVYLTLKRAERKLFHSETQFFRWLCANTTQQLSLPSELAQFWDKDIGAVMNCTVYFQSYILPALDRPLILVVEDIDELLESSSLSRDFLSMMRFWFEKPQIYSDSSREKLRVILSYSTEKSGIFSRNTFPVNAGLCLELLPFTPLQVFDLAQRHGLNLSEQQLTEVIELCGGFPYLVRRLFYEGVNSGVDWEELIETSAKDWGIFGAHLREKLELLERNQGGVEIYKNLLKAEEPVQLKWKQAFPLKSLGLVHLEKGKVSVSCGLYRQYFREYLE